MKSILAGAAVVVTVTVLFAFLASRNADFAMPDLAQVARLLPMRSQCEASIQDLVQKKLIMGIGRDGETTIDITVDGRAWGHLPSADRSAMALAIYCARMPEAAQPMLHPSNFASYTDKRGTVTEIPSALICLSELPRSYRRWCVARGRQ
jgi:hypothetical protein